MRTDQGYRAGFARADITELEPGRHLWGWGDPEQRVEGVGRPLFARAVVVERGGRCAALACLDLGAVSWAIRERVLQRLARAPELSLGAHEVMLTATHTHSAPDGISPFLAYHANDGGISEPVIEAAVRGAVEAIRLACARREPAELVYGEARIPRSIPIAFNRSLRAFRANRDAVDVRRPEDATRRVAPVLAARDERGRVFGLVQWFGVHGTSLHADHRRLDPDNKGRAAEECEARLRRSSEGRDDVVAIFAQEACGDVSPNDRWDRRRGWMVGRGDSDEASAAIAGALQSDAALRALEGARPRPAGAVGGRTVHVDLADAEVDADLAGRRGVRTRPPRWGLMMPVGTAEGPGPFAPAADALELVARALGRLSDDGRAPFCDLCLEGRAGGVVPVRLSLDFFAALPPIAYLRALRSADLLDGVSFAPTVLPVQLLRLGPVTLLGMPCEPTTMAGQRLRRSVAEALPERTPLVIAGLANAYAGYCTTEEEHRAHAYEGACTLYGPHTLGAFRTTARRLARAPMADPSEAVSGPEAPAIPWARLRRQRALGAAFFGASSGEPVARRAGRERRW
jgi:neutral ceramidase